MKMSVVAAAIAAVVASVGMTVPAFAHQGETHATAPQKAGGTVPQTAEGEGVVRAVDVRAGNVTLAHGPIASLRWPAMTMKFPVSSADMLTGVTVGTRVHFVLTNNNGRPMVTEIHKL